MSKDQNSNVIASASVTDKFDFALRPSAGDRASIASELGIQGVKKLVFSGQVEPLGARDLVLYATLGATVVQDCVVTGDPVTTRIDERVERKYFADLPVPTGEEMEMPEDETADLMPERLDLEMVMLEALALALPPWPRAEGVALVDLTVTEPGKTPMTDEDTKPFAALKSLAQTTKMDGDDKG